MEGLSIDNILGAEDIENLFTEFEETEGATPEESGEQIVDKDTTEVDVDNLFTEGPESVVKKQRMGRKTLILIQEQVILPKKLLLFHC